MSTATAVVVDLGDTDMRTITLTAEQAARYDSDDDSVTAELMAELRREHGRIAAGEPVEIEVRHPVRPVGEGLK